MGERKGVNKYYPPDFDPSKGGLNAYHGTHALRERARKLHEGILIIRFEMPYNIWCNGCGNHIGMGVRYNAQKRKVGNFYTTPIYKFRMKCHLCDQHFEIRTDPENCDYEILSGCRRKEERWDTEKAGNVQTTEREVKEKLTINAMFKLEHQTADQSKVKKIAPTLCRLEEIRDTWEDDFSINRKLRKKFREEKKEMLAETEKDNNLKRKMRLPLELELLKESEEDRIKAGRISYGNNFVAGDMIHGKHLVKKSSIFGTSGNSKMNLAKNLANKTKMSTSSTSTKKIFTPQKHLGVKVNKIKVFDGVETNRSTIDSSQVVGHSIGNENYSNDICDSISKPEDFNVMHSKEKYLTNETDSTQLNLKDVLSMKKVVISEIRVSDTDKEPLCGSSLSLINNDSNLGAGKGIKILINSESSDKVTCSQQQTKSSYVFEIENSSTGLSSLVDYYSSGGSDENS